MPCPGPDAVADLLAARDAGGRDEGVRGGRAEGGEQPLLADLHRQVVVLCLEAERARHPAAAGVELGDLRPRDALEQRDGRRRARERLLVAVAVEEDRAAGYRGVASQDQRTLVDRLDEQLLDQPRLRRDRLRALVARQQAEVLLAQRQQARRLAADDR